MPAFPELPDNIIAQRLIKEIIIAHIKEHKHLYPAQVDTLGKLAATTLRRRKVEALKRTRILELFVQLMTPYIEYPGKRPLGLTDNGYAIVKALQRVLLPYKDTPEYSCAEVCDIAEDLNWTVAKVQGAIKNVYNQHLATSERTSPTQVIIALTALGWALE